MVGTNPETSDGSSLSPTVDDPDLDNWEMFDESTEKFLLSTDDDALTLIDLLGFLDEVKVPDSLRKRTKAWGNRLQAEQKKMAKKFNSAKDRLKEIQNGLRRRGNEVTRKLEEHSTRTARRIITGDSNKRVRDYVKEPPVVRMIDCVSFTLGVILLVSAEFMTLRFPHFFWIFYVITAWAMIITRCILWWGGIFKYFLFDFCYFVNAVCSLVVLFFPNNTVLNQVCFVWANGPVVLAMVTWRNSLVFHSLEKVTTLYIHATPSILTLCIRWYSKGPSPMCEGGDEGACSLSLWNWWVMSFSGYLLWQVLQLMLTEVLGGEEIQKKGLQTSCRWISTHPRMPVHFLSLKLARSLGIMGKDEKFNYKTWKTKIIFVTFQAGYTFFTMLPCKVLFESFWAHLVYLFILYVYCVWNGARYYIHIFAERYTLQFIAKDDNIKVVEPPPAVIPNPDSTCKGT
mmetsp:Transcript_25978/g.43455  ORF Transcript_25978/g.43455 Transcript_25978/m.43455 type:complete len:456 (-) Transcript_25978:207-1574(-)